MALKKIFAEVDMDNAIIAGATPDFIEGNFALARRIDHAAGDDKFSVSGFFASEELVRGKDHVLETFDGIDGFNGASILFQNGTEILPLSARFCAVYCVLARHVRIFLIHDIEIIRSTHEHRGHRRDGSGGAEREASN